MMRGLLSPSSISNRLVIPSPSSKSKTHLNMTDSHSTLCASQAGGRQDLKSCSFKKIREMKVRQNSERDRVVKKYVVKPEEREGLGRRMKTLDDAKTIVSHNSEHSSVHQSKCIVEESIIIMRGGQQEATRCFDDQPSTPFFKRRNTYTEQGSSPTQYLKVIRHYPPLLSCIESGTLCHFQVSTITEEAITQIKNIQNEGVLQLFSVQPIPHKNSSGQQMYLILYEPYTQSLSQVVSGKGSMSYKQFLAYLVQIIKTLSHLANQFIFPDIQPSTVLLSNSALKIKIRPCGHFYLESERDTLRQCGFYFNMLMSELAHSAATTPSKLVYGLTIGRRLSFETLMTQFIRTQEYTLDEAYLKLQALASF